MKKTILALSLAGFALGLAGSAFAAMEKPCDPPRDGYVLDMKGKCVKAPAEKK
jgi:hypothetical protein